MKYNLLSNVISLDDHDDDDDEEDDEQEHEQEQDDDHEMNDFIDDDDDEHDAMEEDEEYLPYKYESRYSPFSSPFPPNNTDDDGEEGEEGGEVIDSPPTDHDDDGDDDGDNETDHHHPSDYDDENDATDDDDNTKISTTSWRQRHTWLLGMTNNGDNNNDDTNDDERFDNDEYDNNRQIQPHVPHPTTITHRSTFNPPQQQPQNHYHIYYYNNDDDLSRRRRATSSAASSCGWFLVSFIAVVAHILYWYGPSVPPPHESAMTWTEYNKQQFQVVAGLLSNWMQLTGYVSFWTWQGIRQELWKENEAAYYEDLVGVVGSPGKTSNDNIQRKDAWETNPNHRLYNNRNPSASSSSAPPACQLHPERWTSWEVFGQDLALQSLERALQQQQPTPKSSNDNSSPFWKILYATGRPSVGKKYLARQIEWHMRRDCPNDYYNDNDDNDDDLLLEISSAREAREAIQDDRIQRHVTYHPNGSVLMLSDIDTWGKDDDDGTALDDLLSSILERDNSNLFSNCILYLTSSIGNVVIDKALRKWHSKNNNNNNNISELQLGTEMESLVAYKLLQAHQNNNNNNNIIVEDKNGAHSSSSSQLARLLDQQQHQQLIHVLPMLPLTKDAMTQLLEYQLYLHFGIDIDNISPDATSYLLEHMVEWQTWALKSAPDTSQLWKPHAALGAKAMEPIVTRITNECNGDLEDDNDDNYDNYGTRRRIIDLQKRYEQGPSWLVVSSCLDSTTKEECKVQCEFSIV